MDHPSPEQQRIIDIVMEGGNVLVTGAGGTGKSFLLHRIIDELCMEGVRHGVCGTTGVAAVNVGGTTIHSWAGLGLGEGHVSTIVGNIRNNKPAFDRIRTTRVWLVDEVSMLSSELLTKIDKVFRIIRGVDKPFGGMQVVFFGDFLQLPPVNGSFAFLSPSWAEANISVHVLTRVFRQEDREFAYHLSRIREGIVDDNTRAFFATRANVKDPEPEILPVAITATNAMADAINSRHLREIKEPSKFFMAKDTGSSDLLNKGVIPQNLELKIGARVMCLHNVDLPMGVVNGSTGYVTEFVSGLPVVEFDNGHSMMIEHITRELTRNGDVIASRFQVPLRLSWAVSSHKIQGQTLDKVELHMGNAFEMGQTYVALSRVRSKEGLFIKSINKANLTANPIALKFYREAQAAPAIS